jgi:transcriptional regulator of nitric oxide reductase
MEDRDADRTAGVFQLLHLPARFARSQKYLANLAMAEVCLELDRRGDPEGMAAIKAELESQGPDTPALVWLESRLEQRRPTSPASDGAVGG